MDATTDPDRRVEAARQSLLAHVEELGRRIHEAKEKLDLRAHIAAHPRAAAGIAFAAGMLLALPKRGHGKSADVERAEIKGGVIGVVTATLGTLAFALVKNVAVHHLSGMARDWWDRRSAMESATSHEPDIESFLEH